MDEEITLDDIYYALEQEIEQAAWEIWVQCYPHFSKENFQTFEEFKKEKIEKQRLKTTTKSDQEIHDEITQVMGKFQ